MVETLNKRNFRQIVIVYVKNDEKNTGKLEKTFQSDYSKAPARKELKINNKKIYKKLYLVDFSNFCYLIKQLINKKR